MMLLIASFYDMSPYRVSRSVIEVWAAGLRTAGERVVRVNNAIVRFDADFALKDYSVSFPRCIGDAQSK